MKRGRDYAPELNVLSCELCSQRYDLNSHCPTMLRCCFETACKECWAKGFEQGDGFSCPYKCGAQT